MPFGQAADQVAGQRVVLMADAHTGGRAVADDQKPQRRTGARASRTGTCRLGQAPSPGSHPERLGHDNRKKKKMSGRHGTQDGA